MHCGCACPRGKHGGSLRAVCVYKGSCELNKAHSTSSICLACKHLAAFHEQGNLTSSGSSTRPPSVEKLTAKDGTPCTNTALNEAKRFRKTKSFAEWKAKKSSSASSC